MEERSRIVQLGHTSHYVKIPRDFRNMHGTKPGEYFLWSYNEETNTAFLRYIKPKEPKPEPVATE
jgi:hypothetical protein